MVLLWLAVAVASVFEGVLIISGLQMPVLGAASVPRLLLLASLMATVVRIAPRLDDVTIDRRLVRVVLPLSCWFIYTVLSFAWSQAETINARYVFVTAFNAVVFVSAAWLARNPSRFRMLFYAPLLIALAAGFVELATGFRFGASRQQFFRYEVVGPFINPLFFAFLLASYAGPLLYLAARGTAAWRASHLVLYGASVWLLLHTASRTGLLGLLVGSTIGLGLAATTRGRRLSAITAGVVILVGALGVASTGALERHLPAAVTEKLRSAEAIASRGGFATTSRGQAVLFGLQVASRSPVFGGGAGFTEQVLSQSSYAVETGNVNAHNWALELLLNGGLVSILLFALAFFFLVIAVATRKKELERAGESQLAALPGALLPALIVLPILSVGPSSLSNTATPWLLCGLAAGAAAMRPHSLKVVSARGGI